MIRVKISTPLNVGELCLHGKNGQRSNETTLSIGSTWETNSDILCQSPGFCWPIRPPHPPPNTDFDTLYAQLKIY